jgi:hypothetical protein
LFIVFLIPSSPWHVRSASILCPILVFSGILARHALSESSTAPDAICGSGIGSTAPFTCPSVAKDDKGDRVEASKRTEERRIGRLAIPWVFIPHTSLDLGTWLAFHDGPFYETEMQISCIDGREMIHKKVLENQRITQD